MPKDLPDLSRMIIMSKFLCLATAIMVLMSTEYMQAQQVAPTTSDSVATVYFIKEITSENILKIYDGSTVGPQAKCA